MADMTKPGEARAALDEIEQSLKNAVGIAAAASTASAINQALRRKLPCSGV